MSDQELDDDWLSTSTWLCTCIILTLSSGSPDEPVSLLNLQHSYEFFQRTLGDHSLASLEDDIMSKGYILKSHCKLSNSAGLKKDAGQSKTNKQATVFLSLQICAV